MSDKEKKEEVKKEKAPKATAKQAKPAAEKKVAEKPVEKKVEAPVVEEKAVAGCSYSRKVEAICDEYLEKLSKGTSQARLLGKEALGKIKGLKGCGK